MSDQRNHLTHTLSLSGEGGVTYSAEVIRDADGMRIVRVSVDGPRVRVSDLRGFPYAQMQSMAEAHFAREAEPVVVRRGPRPRQPVRPPASGDAEWYRNFASRYVLAKEIAARVSGTSAASMISAEYGVPVTTVHRWAYRARRLGFLPNIREKKDR